MAEGAHSEESPARREPLFGCRALQPVPRYCRTGGRPCPSPGEAGGRAGGLYSCCRLRFGGKQNSVGLQMWAAEGVEISSAGVSLAVWNFGITLCNAKSGGSVVVIEIFVCLSFHSLHLPSQSAPFCRSHGLVYPPH